jgi:tripartite-type tricarboxylate transporter receptor subunit TctC
MKGTNMLLRFIVPVAALLVLASGPARAQEAYPNKPVRVIVPFAPGGPADLIARVMAQKLAEEFGKQFYIENHAGAGGNLGVGLAARAPNDGYSIMVNSQATVTNRSLYKSLPYDPFKDLIAVTRIATTPNVVVVHPSVPAKTMKELVDLIRGGDDKYHGYAHPGLGTPSNLYGEFFRQKQNLKLTSIPFGGGGPMIQSVVAGHTPVAFSSLPPATAHIQAGRLRALAVTADKRHESLPDVPTMAEAGYPGQTGETPIGIFVPDGTPKEIVDLLHRKVVALVATADVKQKLANIGFTPIADTPAEFTAFLKGEDEKWGQVIRDAGIKME